MVWNIKYDPRALKGLKKIDKTAQNRIVSFFDTDLAFLDNPRVRGKSLRGKFKGLWRYRIGDYRAICHIEDKTITIIVLEVGHRKHVYDE